ncbi:MAG TPA: sn-glycerol-3-phosphate ABC transporter ATP-binding protein UgpC [Solirubrobacterales bacterium]|jgi:multiple sugar transport system ATP-binding protein|nr:sn-glycerol-3-phosphate ABC transporter ATP-binding protein UgpC [Solirubrobacterales bacterium]
MSEIVFDEVTKRFPDGTEAVKKMSLDIPDGEFVILVGPSGCGKSTALRMIAGLEDISEGELKIDDQVVNDLAPKDRDIAMVFQNYALYPHMTVGENMAFPLKLAGVDRAEREKKVSEAAETLDLTELLDRRPANLSGGQRQRVAMGRAIVRDPKAYLMDEPLSNLDAKLRVQMRTEVARIQQRLGTTTVYVTHDQTEAMTLGDRVAVMRAGALQQVGKPTELYNHPANLFVAGFIGSPAMNFVPGTLSGSTVRTPFGELPVSDGAKAAAGGGEREVIVGVRPEHFDDARVVDTEARRTGTTFKAKLDLVEALGAEYYAYFHLEGTRVESEHLSEVAADAGLGEVPSAKAGETSLVARLNEMSEIQEGDEIELWLDTSRLHLFDPDSGENLAGTPSGNGAAASAAKAAEKPVAGQAG